MRRLVPLFVVLALLMVGCGKGGFSKAASAGKENVFRYPIPTKPTTLDPAIVQDGDTIDIIQQVFEGLVSWSTENKVIPNLAEKWTVSPDGKVYTFTLKKGVKFFNGDEVTADDFKFSIERACNPKFSKGMALNYLSDIVGVKERLTVPGTKDVKGVVVKDPYTLEITIDKPRPYFLGKLTYPVSFVISKKSAPEKDGEPTEMTQVSQMVGTGAYKPVSYEEGQLFTMEANKAYHGGAPKIDRIERPVILDAQTRLNKFKSGELDLVALERQDVDALQKDPTYKSQLHSYLRPSIYYVGFNVKEYPAFANQKVRQAFAMAIDRDRIVDKILGGMNQKADTIIPPGVIGHRDKGALPAYDVAGAKKLLAEAGYPDGKGLPNFEIDFRESRPDVRIVAEAVQNDLKNNLGVNITPRAMEWRAFLEKHDANKVGFFHMRWAADYLDPQNFLSLLLSTTGAENHTYYSNPEFDKLCEQADSSMDNDLRMKLYAQAEDICLKDCAWVPIYYQRDVELISPRVSGLRESLFGHLPHTTVALTAPQ
jgi:oligopeptide transport system substrate-binding protein